MDEGRSSLEKRYRVTEPLRSRKTLRCAAVSLPIRRSTVLLVLTSKHRVNPYKYVPVLKILYPQGSGKDLH